jgi:hypothetical protein
VATTTEAPARSKRKTEDEKPPALKALAERTDPNKVGEFNTLAPERKYIEVDDERHLFRLMQDFGSIEHQEWSRNADEFDELFNKPKLNSADRKRYEFLLDWLLDRALVDPKRLRGQLDGEDPETGQPRLTGALKREIIVTFTGASQIKSVTQALLEQIQQAIEAQDGSTPVS